VSTWRVAVLGIAAVLALVTSPPRAAAQTSARQPGDRLVLGYYVPYDTTSWASLEAHADELGLVATQWVTIDACGGLTSRDDQTLKQLALSRGLAVVPSLLTGSSWLNHQLLTDDATAATAIQHIVDYTVQENYAGFDLDLENIDPDDRAALSDFVAALAPALHDQGKLLTLAIPAKDRDVTTGWAGAYDYAALGAQADLVTIMAYEYRGPFSGPGSVAPFDWVARVTAFATQQIAPNKVLLGLAFYGYDWNTSSGGAVALGYPRAVALADHEHAEPVFDPGQRSLAFSYTQDPGDVLPPAPSPPRLSHTITTRTAPACDLVPPPSPPPTPRPTPPADTPQEHQVWVEDSLSAAARLQLADAYGARGVATWRLGLEDPNVWPLFDQWRQAARS
jgi:spore germination protein YaaH